MSEKSKVEINLHEGGQVNVALDSGNVNSVQNNVGRKSNIQSNIITYGQDITLTNNFVGRGDEISMVLKKLEKNDRILISGMGGIGKTTILKKLYHTIVESNKNSNNKFGYFEYKLSMDDTIYNALEFEKTGDRYLDMQKAKKALENYANCSKLIIFIDNIPTEKYEEIQQLASVKGKIIITSRQNEYENYETVFIDKMSTEECKKLFERESGICTDTRDLDYIINTLIGRHTLTVKLLAKIAKKKQWTIEVIKNKLTEIGFKIEYRDLGKTTNILSEYKKLYSISGLNSYEKSILEGFSLLREAQLYKNKYQKFLAQDAEDEENDKLYELYEKGWLERNKDEFSIHPVFAEFIAELEEISIVRHEGLYKSIKSLCLELDDLTMLNKQVYLTELISFGKNVSIKCGVEKELYNIAFIARYFAEYNNAIIILQRIGKTDEENYIKAQLLISEIYTDLSNFEKANEYFDRIEEIWSNEEKEQLSYLYIEYKIDYSLYLDKSAKTDLDRENAIKELEELMTLEMDELTQGRIYNCLGGFYTNLKRNVGNLNKALEYHEKAKNIREKSSTNIMDLARTYNNIANVYFYKSKNEDKEEVNLQKAEKYYIKSMDLRKKALNNNHPDIARVLVNLGNVYVEQGKYTDALDFMQKGLKIREKVLGKYSSEVGGTYANMARVYDKLQDKENVLKCLKKAKEIYLLLYGEKSDKYINLCKNYENVISDM
ncbi:MAG: ATP-binding protein [Lachnospiraceae bacterium]|nr:ATP-binding protein [Lachnospiraceae bacterium]